MPQSQSASDILTTSLKVLGVIGQGEAATAHDLADGLIQLNNLVGSWRTERLLVWATLRTEFPLVANQQAYTIGLGGQFNVNRPIGIPYAGLILTNQTPNIEVPITPYTVKDWSLVGIKALQSTQPTAFYYNFGQPQTGLTAGLGTIEFWPVPQIAYRVALYLPQVVEYFPDLTTQIYFGDGYVNALVYDLALVLARPNGLTPPSDVVAFAKRFKADVKRSNTRLSDLSIDPALRPSPGNRYNWRTDQLS